MSGSGATVWRGNGRGERGDIKAMGVGLHDYVTVLRIRYEDGIECTRVTE